MKRFWNKPLLNNEFIKKLLESFVGRGTYIIFMLLFSFFCTRLYGAEIYGEFTYAFTLVTMLMVVSRAGFDQSLIYSIPKNGNKHITMSFVLNFLFSFVIVIIFTLYLNNAFIRFMLPMVWLFAVEYLFFALYKSEQKIKEYYFINGFIALLLRILLCIIFYFIMDKSAYSIGLAVYISFIVSIFLYFRYHKNKFDRYIFDIEHLKYSLPLTFATSLGIVINKVDIIMIGNFLDNTSVGIYQITVQVSNLIAVILIVFNTVFAPRISTLYHNNEIDNLKALYIKVTRFLSIIAIIITVPTIVFSESILNLFGSEFSSGQLALIYRSIGQFINIAVGGVWLMLSMTGQPKFQMYANIIALFINIILNYQLIPIIGINGAAIASMITLIFINVSGYLVVSRRFGIKVYKVI
ncbi:oligosaccharide flippase family protein [Gracilibacillus thailandensis]|uniref:Oligosaccharide flippase family protein n=1 Tax=Gracilibacillus thailandensis TaxID=563735 RepID=A0A6N7QZ46_9BACI|nr:oligosaccharide flippase family protein [Gracilibacillus thailandensis]MRI67347.1 oligosaccharide flippase family protein [Gracilibacillus thailandensis]